MSGEQQQGCLSGKKKFKILSIDGGGIRGIIPCKLLTDLESELMKRDGENARLADYFDLICGTSTGGIIAIGLALGLTAKEILDLYEENGNDIFPGKRRTILNKLHCFFTNKPFYNRNRLKALLQQTYNKCTRDGDTRLGHAKTRLVIPTYNAEHGKIHVFKTAHAEGIFRDYQIPAVDAALSTAAAPAYFEPYSFTYTNKGTSDKQTFNNLVDGGLVANNPAYIGLIEATEALKVSLHEVSLLSLGTGLDNFTTRIHPKKMGPRYWTNPLNKNGICLYNAMASAQSEDIDNKLSLVKRGVAGCHQESFEYLRVQYTFNKGEAIDLDDTSTHALTTMNSIAQQLFRTHGAEIERKFLQEKKNDFQPLKTL